ncbi:primpol [Symbiodinium sp. CCMP2456]|nr:primpol [Symbiodinium sp. CCMP2456]
MSKSIIDRLLDSQYTQETLRDEDCWAETQCDSTQPDSELRPAKLWDVEPTPGHDVCTTDEDVETTASEADDKEDHRLEVPFRGIREVAEADIAAGCNAAALRSSEDLELCLRRLGGLGHSPLHPPPPRSFARQAEAIRYLEGLLAQGVYRLHQLGLYSREFSSSGCRRFLVDTKVGFALESAPSSQQCDQVFDKLPQKHLYEVLMETQPCWLYFDLEFHRCVNPNLDPGKVISAFYDLLNQFCLSTFGLTLDTDNLFELDSTTEEKFSKHVIAKRLQTDSGMGGQYHFQSLAFPNNAQAGFFVKKFMDFVRQQRLARRCAASLLFARAKPKKQKENQKAPAKDEDPAAENASADEAAGSPPSEVPVVDESVYTRNRCFRVLFSSKFGKRRPLLPTWKSTPAVALFESLVAGVPEGTPLFRHPILPPDVQHKDLRRNCPDTSAHVRPRLTADDVKELPLSENAALHRYLVELWDDVRIKNEGQAAFANPTRVQRSLLMGSGEYMVVSLVNNRFCFKKGASHKSNGIYLVINQKRWVVYQKCHDAADCPDFRSHEFSLPEALRPEGAVPEDAFENGAVDEDHDPVSQELLTQIMATPPPLPDELLTPPRLPCYSRLPSRSRSPCRALCRLRRTGLGQKPRRSLQPCLGQSQPELSDTSPTTPPCIL